MKVESAELASYFEEWLNTAFTNGLIDYVAWDQIQAAMKTRLPGLVEELNGPAKTASLALGGKRKLEIVLRPGRDPKLGDFNLFEMRWPGKPKAKRLQCFVGHRFIPYIEKTLRWNLRHCLESSNIDLVWSGKDLNAVGFFDEILKLIETSHFCIFDDQATEGMPNVYIEAGIAYALKTPFLFAHHEDNPSAVPSDLGHIASIRYRDYRDLTKKIYFHLPVFLNHTGLRG